ncbi:MULTISPECIES: PASTA domain-containing protein [Spirosoma]|uniref:PASTA domain-containing protein n=1 Tax=Spirosoma liriopis TaxID=2937440 RepID=A0ABT0HF53_9BACT|nr:MULTISPECIES: PASTA domain-containing protein [Spirosoma]MCK8490786.1 PASTA domain-containing protein [Spirosoma liriopis]UHG90172.1 PASTA domain-containing protein [Spirosoma oryzicola]
MAKISTRSFPDLLIQIGIIAALVAVLFLGFFFVYLPFTTNHGQTITVPDVSKLSLDETKNILDDRNLRYEVSDCTFVAGAQPLTVVQQYPRANVKVKEGRKIYITVTKRVAPMVSMPNLVDMIDRSAARTLESLGLAEGERTYVPDVAKNSVLRQLYNGKEIAPGTPVPKGAKIDLEVGDGLGNTMFAVPNVVGLQLDEAEAAIRGSNLKVGTKISVEDPEKEVGTVVRQRPEARSGERIRVGETMDLWVVGPIEPNQE